MNYSAKLEELREFFCDYAASFMAGDELLNKNIEVKRVHSLRVLGFSSGIALSLGLDRETSFIASAAALGHDIGRFEQFKKYRTFNDARSVNHGLLSAEVMEKTAFLNGIPGDAQRIIYSAVKNHNAIDLPVDMDERTALVTRIVRDADKIDIFRIAVEFYNSPESGTDSPLVLGLENSDHISGWVVDSVLEGKKIPMRELRTVSEFKLLQMGWVFDINFPYSIRMIRKKNYISMIADTLPSSRGTASVISRIMDFLDSQSR